MENINILLWVMFGLSSAIYWWVGKVYISQPKFNHPAIFWSPTRAKALLLAPQLGFLLSIIGGFIYTQNGWWYLGAVAISFVVLSSKPSGF